MLCLVTQWCLTLCNPVDCSQPGSSIHGDSPGKNTGVVSMPSSRGSSQPRDQTQVSRIADGFCTNWDTRDAQEHWSWVAYHFSRGSSQPRYPTKCSAGGFFTSWATREAQLSMINTQLKYNKISYIIPQPRRTKNKGNSKNNNYWSMIIGIPWWLSQ